VDMRLKNRREEGRRQDERRPDAPEAASVV